MERKVPNAIAGREFASRLKRQLELVWASCRDFDDGNKSKALEIAVRLRVIFHSTEKSVSALRHLNSEAIHLLSTAAPQDPIDTKPPLVAEGGLTILALPGGWQAARDRASNRRFVPFQEWWETEAVSVYERPYTRRMIVLDSANKDDGTHIPKKSVARLDKLIEGPWKGPDPESNANLALQYLRQIAYEALHSPELLRLVGADFHLPTDAEHSASVAKSRDEWLSRLQTVYDTSEKLRGQDALPDARSLNDSVLGELETKLDSRSARLYCQVRLSSALSSRLERIACLRKLLDDFKHGVKGIDLRNGNLDIYARVLFYLSDAVLTAGDLASAEPILSELMRLTFSCMPSVPDEAEIATSEQLYFYLWAASNLIIIKKRNTDFFGLLEVSSAVSSELGSLYPGMLETETGAVLCQRVAGQFAADILYFICRIQMYRALALAWTEDKSTACGIAGELRTRFGKSDDPRVAALVAALPGAIDAAGAKPVANT